MSANAGTGRNPNAVAEQPYICSAAAGKAEAFMTTTLDDKQVIRPHLRRVDALDDYLAVSMTLHAVHNSAPTDVEADHDQGGRRSAARRETASSSIATPSAPAAPVIITGGAHVAPICCRNLRTERS
jgi:hypothetical protein